MDNIETLHKVLKEMLDYIDDVCKKENMKYSLCAGTVLGAVRHNGFIPWDDDLDIMVPRTDYKHFLEVFRKQNNLNYFVQEGNGVEYPLYFSKIRKNGTTFIEKNKLKKKWKNMHQGCYIDVFPIEYAHKNPFYFKFQIFFARILQAQALFERGYNHASIIKKVIMLFSMFLYPFKNKMYKFVISVKKENARGMCSFLTDGGRLFPVTLFDEMIDIDFEGKKYPIPKEYEKYLVAMYGETWRIPPNKKDIEYKIHCSYFSEKEDYSENI